LSEGREALREYFEVNERHIAWTALNSLYEQNAIDKSVLKKAGKKLDITYSEGTHECR